MGYLLDTHTLLWALVQHHKLSQTARTIIENPNSVCYASSISFFEMAIKKKTGKLQLAHPISRYYNEVQKIGIQIIASRPEHFDCYDHLSLLEQHRDPFDRLLIATAIIETLDVITIDPKFGLYDNIRVVW